MLDSTQQVTPIAVNEEEKIVAELETLGIRYLSRLTTHRAEKMRPAGVLLADLIRQPSARVREAVIAVLLARPDFAEAVPEAVDRLALPDRLKLKLFYTAAMLLQQIQADRLRSLVKGKWQWLPDLFSHELGLPLEGTPAGKLTALGEAHSRLMNVRLNWRGTYINVAEHLQRRWEMERQWNR